MATTSLVGNPLFVPNIIGIGTIHLPVVYWGDGDKHVFELHIVKDFLTWLVYWPVYTAPASKSSTTSTPRCPPSSPRPLPKR